MSKLLKLSSALPGKDEINGLDCLAEALAENPDEMICAIVLLDVRKVEYQRAEDVHVPTVEVRRVEGWLVGDTPQAIREALVERGEVRTNASPLPFGVVDPKTLTKPAEGEECDHTEWVPLEDPELGLQIGQQCERCGIVERWAPEDVSTDE